MPKAPRRSGPNLRAGPNLLAPSLKSPPSPSGAVLTAPVTSSRGRTSQRTDGRTGQTEIECSQAPKEPSSPRSSWKGFRGRVYRDGALAWAMRTDVFAVAWSAQIEWSNS